MQKKLPPPEIYMFSEIHSIDEDGTLHENLLEAQMGEGLWSVFMWIALRHNCGTHNMILQPMKREREVYTIKAASHIYVVRRMH